MQSFIYHREGFTIKPIVDKYIKRTSVPMTKQGMEMLVNVMREMHGFESEAQTDNERITYRFMRACLAAQMKHIETNLPAEKPKRRTRNQ